MDWRYRTTSRAWFWELLKMCYMSEYLVYIDGGQGVHKKPSFDRTLHFSVAVLWNLAAQRRKSLGASVWPKHWGLNSNHVDVTWVNLFTCSAIRWLINNVIFIHCVSGNNKVNNKLGKFITAGTTEHRFIISCVANAFKWCTCHNYIQNTNLYSLPLSLRHTIPYCPLISDVNILLYRWDEWEVWSCRHHNHTHSLHLSYTYLRHDCDICTWHRQE